MSRWEADALAAAYDVSHWCDMNIFNIAGRPLQHLLHWFEQRTTNCTVKRQEVFADRFHCTLEDLVTYKCAETSQEWEYLLSAGAYTREWSSVWELVDVDEGLRMDDMRSQGVDHILDLAADFHRRFFIELTKFPYTIVWVVHQPHSCVCPQRKRVALDWLGLLDDADNAGHVVNGTPFKIATVFQSELQDLGPTTRQSTRSANNKILRLPRLPVSGSLVSLASFLDLPPSAPHPPPTTQAPANSLVA